MRKNVKCTAAMQNTFYIGVEDFESMRKAKKVVWRFYVGCSSLGCFKKRHSSHGLVSDPEYIILQVF